MRIINDEITKDTLYNLAEQHFRSICPERKHKTSKPFNKYNRNYFLGRIEKELESLNSKSDEFKVLNFIYKHIEIIIKGNPNTLISFNQDFENYKNNNDIGTNFYNKKLKQFFLGAYDNFRNMGFNLYLQKWFDSLNIKTCPYCNRNWLTTSLNKNSKSVLYFDVDHYFPKADNPWLAISFYNLIPSCTICNQRIKRDDELEIKKHLHPYLNDMDDILKFDVPVSSLDLFFEDDTELSLQIISRHKSDPEFEKAKNTFNFFNLENLYNTHIDYTREIIQKNIVYSQNYVNELFEEYSDIFDSKEDLLKMIYGNYVLAENIHERPLAKLTKDLMEDFSIK